MSDRASKIAYDLAVVEAMVVEMEPYLKSNLLYWRLSPAVTLRPAAPLLTIGGVLLRTHRLAGQSDRLTPNQRSRMSAAADAFRTVTEEWAAHTEKRMRRELEARLKSWQWFVDDCREQKQSCVAYYATESELRTLLDLLIDAAAGFGNVAPQQGRLGLLDSQFRRWFQPGDFVWDAALEPAYPRDRFWWLYGRPEFPPR
jgi:hypothetical protein